jgi:Holliday junction resolvase RusA-like endonuclease
MVCKAKHVTKPNVQPSNERDLKRWRATVTKAGLVFMRDQQARSTLPVQPFTGPLMVTATHTIQRPRTIPLAVRAWPITTAPGHGDVDKLARALLDGLADAGVYGNDAQVCGLHVWKRYSDSPAVQWIDPCDHLTRPGVVWRLTPIEDAPAELPYEHMLAEDERTGN